MKDIEERWADKVAIVGAGITWPQTPFDEGTIEVWGLNAFWRMKPKTFSPEDWDRYFSRWFQIHQPGSGEGHIDDKDNIEWMRNRRAPMYMLRALDEYPGSVEYPLDRVADKFGPQHGESRRRRYFTSTIDYMIGLAMLLEFPEIRMYGVDLISDTDHEFTTQRESLAYYIGKAEGLGCRVYLPDDCALLRSDHVYGLERQPGSINNLARHLKTHRVRLAMEQQKHMDAYNEHKANFHRCQGAQGVIEGLEQELKARERGLPIGG
ncbi:MAG: hypothetical protein GY783_03400 [Gammaproteobacteria bacterium]|nr:hypothetical protein [Gammaproteobacteria bacterium]